MFSINGRRKFVDAKKVFDVFISQMKLIHSAREKKKDVRNCLWIQFFEYMKKGLGVFNIIECPKNEEKYRHIKFSFKKV